MYGTDARIINEFRQCIKVGSIIQTTRNEIIADIRLLSLLRCDGGSILCAPMTKMVSISSVRLSLFDHSINIRCNSSLGNRCLIYILLCDETMRLSYFGHSDESESSVDASNTSTFLRKCGKLLQQLLFDA